MSTCNQFTPTMRWCPLDWSADGNDVRTAVKSLLFADVVEISKLTDYELRRFVTGTLVQIAERIGNPLARNTWGDGLFLAYDDPSECASVALEIRDHFRNCDWTAKGFGARLKIRIALSTARVFIARDPIRGEPTVWGQHVSRTARLEPVGEPNEVYCLEDMKTHLEGMACYAVDSLGVQALAKGWGNEKVYRLRRDHEQAFEPRRPPSNAALDDDMTVGLEIVTPYYGAVRVESVDVTRAVTEVTRLADGRQMSLASDRLREWHANGS